MYKKIVLAIDLGAESDQLLDKAKQLVAITGAELAVLSVVEPINETYVAGLAEGFLAVDLSQFERQALEQAKKKLNDLVAASGLICQEAKVIIDHPNSGIKSYADKNGCDLIVVGSHGRHGLRLLLGSTANAVLHGTHCDVLAVRIEEAKKS